MAVISPCSFISLGLFSRYFDTNSGSAMTA